MENKTQNNWYQKLLDKISELAEQFGLDDSQTNRFRDFTVSLARDQFKAGNRSGAGWAFDQVRKKTTQGQVA
ncbi:hypothetical protein HQ487_02010 [Candidatus Uhrbacteria bacterium]|nr:hypothetical protein [Candidatus Uhrbacteria bacterium]